MLGAEFMKRKILPVLGLLICLAACSSCSHAKGKTALRAIIVPKFEIGEMSGDFPGEAQLFYERYCPGCREIEIPHIPSSGHLYVNEENGVGILVTGSGKTAAGLSLMSAISSDLYDFSDTYIVSVGCSGGSATMCTLGDVVLVSAVCDYDLGHHVDAHEKTNGNSRIMWFPDDA